MNEDKITQTVPFQRFRVMFHAVLFVLGFSLVFIIGWGGAATVLGRLFSSYKELIGRIGGILIILLGLFILRIINIPWLNYEKRGYWKPGRGGGIISSFMMGVLFAAGWTPCIGPTLGAILTMGLTRETNGQAMILSAGYALGLAIPFLIIGLGTDKAVGFFGRFKKHVRAMEIFCGILVLAMGILMVFNQLNLIALWALKNGLFVDLNLSGTDVPSLAFCFLAGLLSFLSPCVLPLVPAYLGYLGGTSLHQLE